MQSLDPSVGIEHARSVHASRRASWLQRRFRALTVSMYVFGFALGPLLVAGWFLAPLIANGQLAVDFHYAIAPGSRRLLAGDALYLPFDRAAIGGGLAFVYPPIVAFLYLPFALLPPLAADIALTIALIAATAAALRVAGVDDWRCYGVALLWAPVLSGLQTGNPSLFLMLALAFVWRARFRWLLSGAVAALALAAKLFLWPLVIWFVATRRYRHALCAACGTLLVSAAAWLAIGFEGWNDWLRTLSLLDSLNADESYSLFAVGLDVGASPTLARAVSVGFAAAVLLGAWVLGRRGKDASSFALTIAAALLFSPVVWLHYFALLLVPVAVASPTLRRVWFLPIAMWAASATGNGAPWQTILVLAVAGAVVVEVLLRDGGPGLLNPPFGQPTTAKRRVNALVRHRRMSLR
jgi:hypothetical protein